MDAPAPAQTPVLAPTQVPLTQVVPTNMPAPGPTHHGHHGPWTNDAASDTVAGRSAMVARVEVDMAGCDA